MRNVIVKNPKRLSETLERMSVAGAGKLHVLADFDRTFTKACVDGEEVPSLISILRKEKYLTPDYPEKAQKLFEKYHPIEVDPEIPKKEKMEAMRDWWNAHFDLLIRSGLNKNDLKRAMSSGKSQFRKNALAFIDLLHERQIPLVFMSSSGLGIDSVSMRLEREGRLYENVHIVSNVYEWNKNGNAIGVKDPIIHCMNKSEVLLKGFPFFKKIRNRNNVLLLGDNVEDLGMIEGFEYENLLSIGFLNKNIEQSLENYENAFDAVIVGDGEMDFALEILEKIIKASE